MISAIVTAESQAELTERLAAWCVVEAGDQRFNFRFPDTRRLPAIFDALTAKQQKEFAGPAKRWSYVDRNGTWAELRVPGTPSAIAERPKLEDQQFAKLVDSSDADEVLSILADRGDRVTRRHSENYAVLIIALRAANKHPLNSESKIEWCESALLEGLPTEESQASEQLARWIVKTSSTEQNAPAA